jgi:hypothetical protein
VVSWIGRLASALCPPYRRLRLEKQRLLNELTASLKLAESTKDQLALSESREARVTAERDAAQVQLHTLAQCTNFSESNTRGHDDHGPFVARDRPDPATFESLPQVVGRGGDPVYQPPLGIFHPPYFLPINVIVDPALSSRPQINFLLPSTCAAHTSGGPNSAFLLAAELANLGFLVRLISVTVPADPDSELIQQHICKLTGKTRQVINRITFSCAAHRSVALPLGENDIFLSTAWWTAQMVKYLLPRFRCRRFIYLIQDFEPNLHPASANSALALETYDLDYLPVVNSRLLLDHFIGEGIGRFAERQFASDACWFEPAVDRSRYYPEKRSSDQQRRLLVYSRPEVSRNLLEFAVCALMRHVSSGLLPEEQWLFHSTVTGVAGEIQPVMLKPGGTAMLQPLPLLNLDNWSAELRRTDILISLIWSPHTSYPPLEGAACGAIVVTNACGVKTAGRLQSISGNFIAGDPSIEGVTAALETAIRSVDNWDYRLAGSKLSLPWTWEESLKDVVGRLQMFLKAEGQEPVP